MGIVLDKSNNISVIFLDKRYDYTDKVLDLLLKNSATKKVDKAETNKRNVLNDRAEKMRSLKGQENQSLESKARQTK